MNPVGLRDTRYNHIIHMVTAAKGAEAFYTLEVKLFKKVLFFSVDVQFDTYFSLKIKYKLHPSVRLMIQRKCTLPISTTPYILNNVLFLYFHNINKNPPPLGLKNIFSLYFHETNRKQILGQWDLWPFFSISYTNRLLQVTFKGRNWHYLKVRPSARSIETKCSVVPSA